MINTTINNNAESIRRTEGHALVGCLGKTFIFAMLFLLTWWATAKIAERLIPERQPSRIAKGSTAPGMFPVLVLSTNDPSENNEARIVFPGDMEDYLTEHRQHSFLVPTTSLATVNDQIAKRVNWPWGIVGPGQVEILQSMEGQQYLKVSVFSRWGGMDNSYVGWYTATSKGYEPKQFLSNSSAGRKLDARIASLPIALAIWVMGGVIYRVRRWRRNRLVTE